ncbi:hypothetical protein ABEB36_012879 [Hypothenemus hampei]|uniref:Peptidase A2 domain-containing protein n=1 Tax=Hypothenemus hampei TaxID=57062 RepID=A0ABD1E6B4_HYPHA
MANTTIGDARGQILEPAKPKFIQPPIFRPALDSPSSFLLGYERAASGNGWNDNLKIMYLGHFLEGMACKWYQRYLVDPNNETKNWEQIKKDLKSEFMEEEQQGLQSNQFYHKKQGHAENIKQYYYNLQNLADEVNQDMPFEKFQTQFEKGLHPRFHQCYYMLREDRMNHSILKNIIQKLYRSLEAPTDYNEIIPPINNFNNRYNGYPNDNWFRGHNFRNNRFSNNNIRTAQEERPHEVVLLTPGSKLLSIKGIINDRYTGIIIDTGAGRNVIREDFVNSTNQITENIILTGIGGEKLKLTGTSQIKIELGNDQTISTVLVAKRLPKPVILGNDFLEAADFMLNYPKKTVNLKLDGKPVEVRCALINATPLQPRKISVVTIDSQADVENSNTPPPIQNKYTPTALNNHTSEHKNMIKVQSPSYYVIKPNKSIEIIFPSIEISKDQEKQLVFTEKTSFTLPRKICLSVPTSKNGKLAIKYAR